ncbi:MAG: PASTA domain-containing protein [Flavobacteriaceae bacterium]|nr:PASTA domain-containing protein [Flavobacteriaceae bacterium]
MASFDKNIINFGRMRQLRFFISKTFFLSLLQAGVVGVGLIFLLFLVLRFHTRQNRLIEVPNLYQMPLTEAEALLSDLRLNFEVMDSTQFNPEIPPFSIIEHQPRAHDEVKRGRKIYLTLNPSTYRKVSIPNVVQVTYRNAVSSLRAVGLEVGNISYRNNIGKDMVLAMRFDGDEIEPGAKIPKSSTVDLVLGNGRRGR